MTTTNTKIVAQLRHVAESIEQRGEAVLFPSPDGELANDCPFVDRACEAIEHGGEMDAASLASLVHYIADMME